MVDVIAAVNDLFPDATLAILSQILILSASMDMIDPVAQAMPILTSVVSGDSQEGQGTARSALGDIAAGWLREHGHGSAWDDYSRNPQNDSLVRHLLSDATQRDAGFKVRFEAAVATARAEQPQRPIQQVIASGGGDAQIGDRADTISGSRVATRGSTYNETHNRTQNTRVNKKGNPAAIVVALIVVVILVVLLVKGIGAVVGHIGNADAGLTASSTCQQFLNTDEETEQQALVDIAESKGIGGFGSPLALPEIRYECSFTPDMTLGAIIERDRTEF